MLIVFLTTEGRLSLVFQKHCYSNLYLCIKYMKLSVCRNFKIEED